ncbi:MAG: hypothetical protein V4584_05235 [Verrucomicrobiota bacterium]
MGLKAIIALFLGLVIQISQVHSGLAASVAACGDMNQSMSCCEGTRSCPCISESDPDQKPAPLIPATVELKWFVTRSHEPDRFLAAVAPLENPVPAVSRVRENRAGYSGVPLSVAFCSFVI